MLELRKSSVGYDSTRIALDAFPALVQCHLQHTSRTVQLESDAKSLVAAGFEAGELDAFVRQVCNWGGYPGIAGRILKNNDFGFLQACFKDAVTALQTEDLGHEAASAALRALNRVKGLGTPSFASKHLRFLEPKLCPVLDRLIARNCEYSFGPIGYERYARDCAAVAVALDSAEIRDPFPGRCSWCAADVDSAVFTCIRSWEKTGKCQDLTSS